MTTTLNEVSTRFGFPLPTWDELVMEGEKFLRSRQALRRLTTYTELTQVLRQRVATGQAIDTGTYALGQLLVEIEERVSEPYLLTSLVTYLDDNRPGNGFYDLAAQRGLLPHGAGVDVKRTVWSDQVALAHAAV